MSFKDFLNNWHQVQICHLSASSFSDEISDASDVSYLWLFYFTKKSTKKVIDYSKRSKVCLGENLPEVTLTLGNVRCIILNGLLEEALVAVVTQYK
jgi:hypothetical protein